MPEKETGPTASVPAGIPVTHPLIEPTLPKFTEQPAATKTPPLPKKPKSLHPEPTLVGRGETEHKYLQGLVKQAGESQGYRAVIEKELLNGQGKVDGSLERDDETIACEISVTSTPEQEVDNVRKCLEAGYPKVLLLASSSKRLKTLKLKTDLPPRLNLPIRFFLPEELVAYLNEQGAMEGSAEKTIRGYKVKVSHSPIDQTEQAARNNCESDCGECKEDACSA